jgi:hypothetical protein
MITVPDWLISLQSDRFRRAPTVEKVDISYTIVEFHRRAGHRYCTDTNYLRLTVELTNKVLIV